VKSRWYWPVLIGLLLLHFYVRTHHLLTLPPYVDEGYHLKRAALVWSFDQNPGRFSHGKVLLYFWLGLFEDNPLSALPAGRLAIALSSLITAAALVRLGRTLDSPTTGLLALAIYAVLPLAFFFERMALADPFASLFACLFVWRVLVWMRRPTQGLRLGLLIALMTLAKLTTALLPALLVPCALRTQDYRRSLITAGLIVALLWAPLVIPALFAPGSFILVNTDNVRALTSPTAYLTHALRLIAEFTTPPLLIALLPALLIVFAFNRRAAAILLLWLLLLGIVPVLAAGVVTARYFMILAAPLALIFASAAYNLWAHPFRFQRLTRAALLAAAALYLIAFIRPFTLAAHNSPINLPFRGDDVNAYEYLSGELSASDTVWAAAEMINTRAGRFYADWDLCHLLYFYTPHPVTCVAGDVLARILDDLAPGESAYAIFASELLESDQTVAHAARIAVYDSPTSARRVSLWRITPR